MIFRPFAFSLNFFDVITSREISNRLPVVGFCCGTIICFLVHGSLNVAEIQAWNTHPADDGPEDIN
jgi:hypothetical protein